MKAWQFLAALPDEIRRRLPPDLAGFQVRHRASLVQFHYGDPRVHFEVWLQGGARRIELGLHFEHPDPQVNRRWLAEFDARFFDICARLGPAFEPELWTSSWTRLHETWPMEPLTEELVHRVAGRMAEIIETLAPTILRRLTAERLSVNTYAPGSAAPTLRRSALERPGRANNGITQEAH